MPETTPWLTQAWRLRKAAEILLRTAQELETKSARDKLVEDPDMPPEPEPQQTDAG